MNTGKNRVKGLKTELFKKKYQTNPVVSNPTEELKGRDLTAVVTDLTGDFEARFAAEQAYRKQFPLRSPATRQYTEKEIAKMKKNFPMSAEDFQTANAYGITGIPDLTAGQGVNDIRTQDQILGETEVITSTPNSLRNFQNDEFNQEVKAASEQALGSVEKKPKTGKNPNAATWQDYVRTGTGLVSAAKGVYDDAQTREDLAGRIQNLNDRPRYMPNEYEFMGRPGSQSVIYAKDGAEIRTGTSSGAEEAELERGEMFMLPNLDTYLVGGKKHSQGGEDFVLPEGTIVFSDYLKVPGVGKTFSQEAKKYDITKYKETLDNPHAKAVDRTTAEVMMDRNMKKLQQLFQIQQAMNGNSNGEFKEQEKRVGQTGLLNVNQRQTFGPNAPMALTAEQQKQYYLNQGMFNNPGYSNESAALSTTPEYMQGAMDINAQADAGDELTRQIQERTAQAEKNLAASQAPNPAAPQGLDGPGNLGATAQPQLNTATNQNKQVLADETGNVSKTNATDPTSIYRKKAPNGRTFYVEGQGDFANKKLADQYGNDPTNLLVNRYNEFYEELNPLLIDSYNTEVNRPELRVSDGNEVISLLSNGNNELTALRSFYKSINREEELFDVQLDKGYDPNIQRQKAAEKYKTWIESTQFAEDVAKGKINPDGIFFLKNKPVAYKDAQGNTRYKIENPEVDLDAIEKYQSAYKGIASLKKAESKRGKDKDRLRGFRVAPEGLADQVFLGMPISDDDRRAGNTHLGQVLGFEDEPLPERTKPGETVVKDKDKGKQYNTKLQGAGTGKFEPEAFDYPQLAPEIYGMASSQMFPYAIPDYNAPYLMPQTLNIQPQLQDIDNSYVAALNSGADPNNAFIATLGAKQRIYAEKQNFDAQQRASADQVNNQNRFQEDIYDMQALDRVYNTLIASADDAVTAQRQALIASASQKRAVWRQEESRKQFWYNNFVRNFDYDANTRSFKVSDNASKEFADQLAQYGYNGLPEVDNATKTTSNTSSTKTTTKNEQTGTKTTTTEKTTPAATTTTTSTTSSPAPGSTTSVTKTNSTTTKATAAKKPATTAKKKATTTTTPKKSTK